MFNPLPNLRYHDMDSVLDFLILESLYKISVRTSWEVGDRFRSLIDGKYWYGTIKERKPFRLVGADSDVHLSLMLYRVSDSFVYYQNFG